MSASLMLLHRHLSRASTHCARLRRHRPRLTGLRRRQPLLRARAASAVVAAILPAMSHRPQRRLLPSPLLPTAALASCQAASRTNLCYATLERSAVALSRYALLGHSTAVPASNPYHRSATPRPRLPPLDDRASAITVAAGGLFTLPRASAGHHLCKLDHCRSRPVPL